MNLSMFVALLVAVSTSLVLGDTAEDCFNDKTACLPTFRQRFLDEDRFFYGTGYSDFCPGAKACVQQNDGPLFSVMSRLLYSNNTAELQAAVANIDILNVTFHRRDQSWYACSHNFEWGADTPLTVPPTDLFEIPIIHVHSEPEITWTPRTPTTKYMVILYDAPGFILHSVYINCVGGSLDGCENVRPYLGPGVVFLFRTSYTFLVFEQTADLTAAITTGATGAGLYKRLDELLGQLNAYVDPAIKFGVIMELIPDPYSSDFIKHVMSRNTCPLFYSQMDPFQGAVRGMQIPGPQWAPNSFSMSQTSRNPHLASLSVVVDVTYSTKPLSVKNVCCKDYQVEEGTYTVSPFNEPWKAAVTRDPPAITLTPIYGPTEFGPMISKKYTLLLVDVGPALPETAAGPDLYIHWAVTNMDWAQINYGTEVVDYLNPMPRRSTPNTYMFLLFEQKAAVDPEAIRTLCPNRDEVCQTKVVQIITAYDLGNIVGINYFELVADEFSLKKWNTLFKTPYSELCEGREGYDTPCPTQTCGGAAAMASALLVGLLAAFTLSMGLNNH